MKHRLGRIMTILVAGILANVLGAGHRVVAQNVKLVQQRLTPAEVSWSKSDSNQPGSAMRPGLETVFVAGDGKQSGLYSIVFKVPPNTAIPPHSHPDDRSCCTLRSLVFWIRNSSRRGNAKGLATGEQLHRTCGNRPFCWHEGPRGNRRMHGSWTNWNDFREPS